MFKKIYLACTAIVLTFSLTGCPAIALLPALMPVAGQAINATDDKTAREVTARLFGVKEQDVEISDLSVEHGLGSGDSIWTAKIGDKSYRCQGYFHMFSSGGIPNCTDTSSSGSASPKKFGPCNALLKAAGKC